MPEYAKCRNEAPFELQALWDKPYPDPTTILPNDPANRLRELVKDPNASWKHMHLRLALMHILKLDDDVVAVFPTSAGKSMLAILPHYYELGITVILAPLRALVHDWDRRLTEQEVPFEVFSGKGSVITGTKPIVLASYDVTRYPTWQQQIEYLYSVHRKSIIRIVFDEAHFPISSHFRDQLQDLYQLRTHPVQYVLLSATIPPSSEDYITSQYQLSKPLFIRTSTLRPEIKYTIKEPVIGDTSTIQAVKDVVSRHCPHPAGPAGKRTIIFAYTKDIGQRLAAEYGTSLYCAPPRGANEETKKAHFRSMDRLYQAFLQGEIHVLVTTSVLSAGADCQDVYLVIHVGYVKSIISYLQESGRACRNGQPGNAYIIPWKKPTPKPDEESRLTEEQKKIRTLEGLQEITNLISTTRRAPDLRCITGVLHAHGDGHGYSCTDYDGAQWCWNC